MNPRELLNAPFQTLAALPADELRGLVLALLDAFERGEVSDFDRLLLLGTRIAAMGHPGFDLAVVQWAAARPSPRRLDLASTLLAGLWKQGMPGTRVSSQAVDSLIQLHDASRPDEQAEYQYLLALVEALRSGASQNLVHGILEQALQKPLSNPQMDSILKDVIRGAIGR